MYFGTKKTIRGYTDGRLELLVVLSGYEYTLVLGFEQ